MLVILISGAVSILIAAVVVFQVIKKDNTMTGSIGALSPGDPSSFSRPGNFTFTLRF